MSMYSPFSRLLEEFRLSRLRYPEPGGNGPTPLDADRLARAALEVAKGEIGRGELDGQNNCGPTIARYCAPYGDGHMWCGGFVGYCYYTAAQSLGMTMPFRRSLRARTLGANVAAVGRRFTDWREAEPGDVMVIKRAGGNHVGIFSRAEVASWVCVEGNHGPTVTKVRRHPEHERGLWFASIRP